ncbi:hypothetical protein AQUCO_00300154v1 [Aquilegia coerulea]|nr:hypothetical protein AQUCO_00300154v1 [Aquilegia coerulea]
MDKENISFTSKEELLVGTTYKATTNEEDVLFKRKLKIENDIQNGLYPAECYDIFTKDDAYIYYPDKLLDAVRNKYWMDVMRSTAQGSDEQEKLNITFSFNKRWLDSQYQHQDKKIGNDVEYNTMVNNVFILHLNDLLNRLDKERGKPFDCLYHSYIAEKDKFPKTEITVAVKSKSLLDIQSCNDYPKYRNKNKERGQPFDCQYHSYIAEKDKFPKSLLDIHSCNDYPKYRNRKQKKK